MPKRDEYVGLSVPKKVLKPVREIVGSEDSMYTSITDFVKEAIREKIEKLKKLEQSKVTR